MSWALRASRRPQALRGFVRASKGVTRTSSAPPSTAAAAWRVARRRSHQGSKRVRVLCGVWRLAGTPGRGRRDAEGGGDLGREQAGGAQLGDLEKKVAVHGEAK